MSITGSRPAVPARSRGLAALFVDYENLYYFLKESYADLPELHQYIVDMLRNLRGHIERRLGLQTTIMRAYGDFEKLRGGAQGPLYLMGVETVHVHGTDHKNAADMRLCIDAVETLYLRQEIEHFVVVAGDRDYIPVIQHLRRNARTVHVAAFRGNVSSDLLQNVGSRSFIDVLPLVDPSVVRRLELSARRQREVEAVEQERDERRTLELEQREAAGYIFQGADAPESMLGDALQFGEIVDGGVGALAEVMPPPSFAEARALETDDERMAVRVLIRHYGHHREVWMSPYLRKLSDALPNLADFERKALLSTIEAAGAIRIEKRRGVPHDYSIVLINHEHPDVRGLEAEEEG